MDVDAHPAVAASFGVRSVPFVTLLRRGAWFEHDEQGEPVPLPPERYDGPLAAGPTVEWLNRRRVALLVARPARGHSHLL